MKRLGQLQRGQKPSRNRGKMPTRHIMTEEERKLHKREAVRRYYLLHREQVKVRNKAWRLANLEQVKAREKAYRLAHPEQVKAKDKAYKLVNSEQIKVWMRIYRLAHREQQRAYRLAHREQREAYRLAHLEQARVGARVWRLVHPEQARAKEKAWRLAHPEAKQARAQRRRARKLELPDTLTVTQWEAILAAYKFRCAYCGKGSKLTMDHIIPLAKNGGTTADNIVPACKHCNSVKHIGLPPKPVNLVLAA